MREYEDVHFPQVGLASFSLAAERHILTLLAHHDSVDDVGMLEAVVANLLIKLQLAVPKRSPVVLPVLLAGKEYIDIANCVL